MDQLVMRVRRLVAATEAYRQAVAEALGVGIAETNALTDLSFHGPLTPSTLAERLGLTSPSVTALVDRLEGAGLVARHRHPLDRRSVFIELTDTGAAALRTMSGMFRADVTAAAQAAAPEHVAELDKLLEQITAGLRARAADPSGISAALTWGLTRNEPEQHGLNPSSSA